MALAQQPPQPLRLCGPDVERLARVARAHVALAHLGQLDGPAILVEQAGGTSERDELARAPERILESRRKQILDRELGDELVEPEALSLADRAQQAVRVAEAGGGDGAHERTVSARRMRGPALGQAERRDRPVSGPAVAAARGGGRPQPAGCGRLRRSARIRAIASPHASASASGAESRSTSDPSEARNSAQTLAKLGVDLVVDLELGVEKVPSPLPSDVDLLQHLRRRAGRQIDVGREEAGHGGPFRRAKRRCTHFIGPHVRVPHGVETPSAQSPAGWRATKPAVERSSFCQREPVWLAPEVSKRIPATSMNT